MCIKTLDNLFERLIICFPLATVTVYIATDRIQQTFVFLFLDANIGVISGGYFVHIRRYRDQCVPPLKAGLEFGQFEGKASWP